MISDCGSACRFGSHITKISRAIDFSAQTMYNKITDHSRAGSEQSAKISRRRRFVKDCGAEWSVYHEHL